MAKTKLTEKDKKNMVSTDLGRKLYDYNTDNSGLSDEGIQSFISGTNKSNSNYPTTYQDPSYMGGVNSSGSFYDYTPSSYDNYIRPEDLGNLDNIRAQNQGSLSAFGNSLGNFVGKTAVNVVGGLTGAVYGGIDALASQDWSKLWDNDLTTALDNSSDAIGEFFKVYKTSDFNEKNVLRKAVSNPIMFADEFMDTLSFTAGAIVTEMISGGLASAAVGGRAANVLGKISKSSKLLNMANTAEQAANIAAKVSTADKLISGAMKAGNLTRQLATGAFWESSVEARNTTKQLHDNMVNDYINSQRDLGINITEDQIPDSVRQDIDNRVQQAGALTMALNMGLVGYSNLSQFPSVFKSFGNARKGLGEAAGDIIQEGTQYASKFANMGRKEAIARRTLAALKNPFMEGVVEEGGQGIISKGNIAFFDRKNDIEGNSDVNNFLSSYGKAFLDTYTTKEGLDEVIMGALIGGIGSPGRGILSVLGKDNALGRNGYDVSTNPDGSKSYTRAPIWDGGMVEGVREFDSRVTQANELVNYLNNQPDLLKAMKTNYDTMVTQTSINKDMKDAISNNDQFAFENAKDDTLFNYLNNRLKLGLRSDVDNRIQDMKNMDIDEFYTAFKGEDDSNKASDRTKKEFQDNTINKLEQTLEDTSKSISTVESLASNNILLEGNEPLKDQLAYLLSKSKYTDRRINDMYKELSNLTLRPGAVSGFTDGIWDKTNRVQDTISYLKKMETKDTPLTKENKDLLNYLTKFSQQYDRGSEVPAELATQLYNYSQTFPELYNENKSRIDDILKDLPKAENLKRELIKIYNSALTKKGYQNFLDAINGFNQIRDAVADDNKQKQDDAVVEEEKQVKQEQIKQQVDDKLNTPSPTESTAPTKKTAKEIAQYTLEDILTDVNKAKEFKEVYDWIDPSQMSQEEVDKYEEAKALVENQSTEEATEDIVEDVIEDPLLEETTEEVIPEATEEQVEEALEQPVISNNFDEDFDKYLEIDPNLLDKIVPEDKRSNKIIHGYYKNRYVFYRANTPTSFNVGSPMDIETYWKYSDIYDHYNKTGVLLKSDVQGIVNPELQAKIADIERRRQEELRQNLSKTDFAISLFPALSQTNMSQGGGAYVEVVFGKNNKFKLDTYLTPPAINGQYVSITNGKAQLHGNMEDGTPISIPWNQLKELLVSIKAVDVTGKIAYEFDTNKINAKYDAELALLESDKQDTDGSLKEGDVLVEDSNVADIVDTTIEEEVEIQDSVESEVTNQATDSELQETAKLDNSTKVGLTYTSAQEAFNNSIEGDVFKMQTTSKAIKGENGQSAELMVSESEVVRTDQGFTPIEDIDKPIEARRRDLQRRNFDVSNLDDNNISISFEYIRNLNPIEEDSLEDLNSDISTEASIDTEVNDVIIDKNINDTTEGDTASLPVPIPKEVVNPLQEYLLQNWLGWSLINIHTKKKFSGGKPVDDVRDDNGKLVELEDYPKSALKPNLGLAGSRVQVKVASREEITKYITNNNFDYDQAITDSETLPLIALANNEFVGFLLTPKSADNDNHQLSKQQNGIQELNKLKAFRKEVFKNPNAVYELEVVDKSNGKANFRIDPNGKPIYRPIREHMGINGNISAGLYFGLDINGIIKDHNGQDFDHDIVNGNVKSGHFTALIPTANGEYFKSSLRLQRMTQSDADTVYEIIKLFTARKNNQYHSKRLSDRNRLLQEHNIDLSNIDVFNSAIRDIMYINEKGYDSFFSRTKNPDNSYSIKLKAPKSNKIYVFNEVDIENPQVVENIKNFILLGGFERGINNKNLTPNQYKKLVFRDGRLTADTYKNYFDYIWNNDIAYTNIYGTTISDASNQLSFVNSPFIKIKYPDIGDYNKISDYTLDNTLEDNIPVATARETPSTTSNSIADSLLDNFNDEETYDFSIEDLGKQANQLSDPDIDNEIDNFLNHCK